MTSDKLHLSFFRDLSLIYVAMEGPQLKRFLQQYKIPGTNGYILGVFQPGITVYNQQLRSLNILHAMIETNVLTKEDKIAVIGGGIAGLTFATAALKLGYSIDLFEKSQILIPYQYGCETRRIHPHFYSWPESLTEYPYCDLPFFNWSHETASTVSKNIYDTFKGITKQAKGQFREFRGTKLSKEDIKWGSRETIIEFDSKKGQKGKNYSKVIVATGFGIEKRLELTLNSSTKETTSTCLSYWRNDEFEQASLTKDIVNTYVISGTGDGALIDLFRLKMRGFTVKLLLDKLKANPSNYKEIKIRLRLLRSKYEKQSVANKLKKNDFLYNEFKKLDSEGIINPLKSIVENLLRKDTAVIVHHRDLTVRELFDFRRASLFNNLVAYVLLSNSHCGFKAFPLQVNYAPWSQDEIFLSKDEIQKNEQLEKENNFQLSELFRSLKRKYPDWVNESVKLIIRHGTEVEAALNFIGITNSQINKIKENQLKDLSTNHLYSIWEPGWWNQFFKDSAEPVEFVEPELVLMCNGFVSALATAIELQSSSNSNFRVTLHRIIRKSDQSFYQQASHYYGDRNNTRLNRPVGRIFPLDVGLVGYSCKTGRSLLLEKTDRSDDYIKTWNALMTEENSRKTKSFADYQNNKFTTTDNLATVETLFTCPVLCEVESRLFPIFCLYIDSKGVDFKDPNLLKLVYTMMQNFVKLFERAANEQKMIITEDLSESLFQIDPNFENRQFNKVIEKSKSLTVIKEFEEFKSAMAFKDFTPHYIAIKF